MTRFCTSALAVLLLAGVCPSIVAAQADDPGTLIPEVTVRSDPDLSYALYLPPQHTLDQRWPVLVLMDPRGRARVPLDLFMPAARDLGYVILSSYDTSSDEPDSAERTDRAVEGMLNDAIDDLSLDLRRIYLIGFSGTARRAWLIGLQVPALAAGVGVFGAGALSSDLVSMVAERQVGFDGVYFGGAGLGDFNHAEAVRTDLRLDRQGVPHTFRCYEGGHGWPPREVATEAVTWFEIRAQRTGRAAMDTAWVRERYRAAIAKADSLEQAGEHYRAWRSYRRAAETFPDASDALAGLDRLALTDEVRETREAVREWLRWEQESEEQIDRGLRLLDEDRMPTLDELVSQTGLRQLRRQLGSRDTLAAQAADRQVAALVVTAGYYLPRAYLEAGEVERAVRSLELAYTARPEATSRICPLFDGIPRAQRPTDTPLSRVCGRGTGESPQRSTGGASGLWGGRNGLELEPGPPEHRLSGRLHAERGTGATVPVGEEQRGRLSAGHAHDGSRGTRGIGEGEGAALVVQVADDEPDRAGGVGQADALLAALVEGQPEPIDPFCVRQDEPGRAVRVDLPGAALDAVGVHEDHLLCADRWRRENGQVLVERVVQESAGGHQREQRQHRGDDGEAACGAGPLRFHVHAGVEDLFELPQELGHRGPVCIGGVLGHCTSSSFCTRAEVLFRLLFVPMIRK